MATERKIMFGDPAWFEPKKVGWGLTPITWQGWVYTAAWVGVLTLPFTALMLLQQFPEAIAWLALGIGALVWDVRNILQEKRWTDPSVVVIGDEENHARTANYDLRVDR